MHVYHHVDFWTIQNFLSHTMWRFVVTWCEMISRDVVSSDEVDVTKSHTTWRHYVMIRNNGTKDISTKWLSDLKSGFCKTQFYMNKEQFSIGLLIGQFNNPFWLVDFRKLKKKQCCWSDINQGRLIDILIPSGSLPVDNNSLPGNKGSTFSTGNRFRWWYLWRMGWIWWFKYNFGSNWFIFYVLSHGNNARRFNFCMIHTPWVIFYDSFRSGGDICKVFGPLCMRKRYPRSQNNFIWFRHAWLSRFWDAYSQGKNNHV